MAGYVPAALVALTFDDAERLCDKLNASLGLSREDWTELATRSRRTETPEPDEPVQALIRPPCCAVDPASA